MSMLNCECSVTTMPRYTGMIARLLFLFAVWAHRRGGARCDGVWTIKCGGACCLMRLPEL
ncbi:unnamed protein product [Periconia digitata]|uniref:Uncharacterized protein n=1 Tax=Periconia digitata TaxID=1303443 RepID=A0A9W4XLQ1_9PLEO|nr:unnamed protein product [Periconia digitata]